MKRQAAFLFCSLVIAGTAGSAQTGASGAQGKLQGTYQRIKVHGRALEGNLEGDSPDRDVSIYLPPSYEKERDRRYPVVYLLHGYTDSDDRWFGLVRHFISVPEAVDKATAAGSREMIVVMPNAYTAFQGSMYSNSVTTGDWETFVAWDLVAYVDSHYRTITNVASRGLAGHSMGGLQNQSNAGIGSSMVPESAKPTVLFRSPLQERRNSAGDRSQVGGQRAARDD